MRVWILVLGAAWAQTRPVPVPLPVPLPDQPSRSTRETLLEWFRGYEFVPTAAHHERLGADLGAALRGIASDESLHLVVRARAVSALVHAPADETVGLLTALAQEPAAPSLLRRKAVLALTDIQGPGALDLLVSVAASDPDVRVRAACARALRALGPAGHAARDTLYRAERDPTVRGLLGATKEVSR